MIASLNAAGIKNLHLRSPKIQPVSQVLVVVNSSDIDQGFSSCRDAVLRWMQKRAGQELPQHAWRGHSFEVEEVGALRTSAVALEQPRYWAARIDDTDKQVPQRIWTTEIAIGVSPQNKVLFGCRLYCVTRGPYEPFEPSIPGVVRQLANDPGICADGWLLKEQAVNVQYDDVGRLVELLINPDRKLPIIVMSMVERDDSYLIDPDYVAKRLCGVAHVVKLDSEASYHLTDSVGKEFSVFGGAIRTYIPSFDPEQDEPRCHPLALPGVINNWNDGPRGFSKFLRQKVIYQSVARRNLEEDLPSYSSACAIARKQKRKKAEEEGKTETELLKLLEEENENLVKQLKEEKETHEGLLVAAEHERNLALSEGDEAKAEAVRLRSRIGHLESALNQSGKSDDVEIPETLEELDSWASNYLAGSVVLLNRAIRAAKKSEFENTELVYQALLTLRDYYVPMRRFGGMEMRAAYEKQLQALGLEETPSFSGPSAGEFDDAYEVGYGGRKRELDRHLKGSNSRHARYGFRVYFFWDDESQQVVVGWLPSHLRNRAS